MYAMYTSKWPNKTLKAFTHFAVTIIHINLHYNFGFLFLLFCHNTYISLIRRVYALTKLWAKLDVFDKHFFCISFGWTKHAPIQTKKPTENIHAATFAPIKFIYSEILITADELYYWLYKHFVFLCMNQTYIWMDANELRIKMESLISCVCFFSSSLYFTCDALRWSLSLFLALKVIQPNQKQSNFMFLIPFSIGNL